MRKRPPTRGRALLIAALSALAVSLLGFSTTASADSAPSNAPGDVGTKIYGGGTVTDDQPSIAALYNGGAFCSASIIAPRWVLTAGHCAGEGDTPEVRVGSLDRTQGGTTAKGVRVVRHPGYNWPGNDIALVQLDQDVQTEYSPLANAGDIAQGQEATIFGWGVENADWSGDLPIGLKYASGTVTDTDCTSANPTMLCFGGNGSAVAGDSGGPLRVKSPQTGQWVQAGVSAVSPIPAGDWSGYTDIAKNRDWIKEVAGV
ncbi:serine protease [Streptomyces sp. B5E4]|uniref:S1 family peptidase n=1 Tax=Streptomyces sp. B5E4 TaxID=3153568 RepID=UPI00325F22FE